MCVQTLADSYGLGSPRVRWTEDLPAARKLMRSVVDGDIVVVFRKK